LTYLRSSSLIGKIKNSMKWNALSALAKILADFGVRIGLAGFLTTEDFGVYFYCLAIIGVISIIPTVGLQPALIQREYDSFTSRVHNLSFNWLVISSITTLILIYITISILSQNYNVESNVVVSIKILSVTILLLPYTTLSTVNLSKEMEFNRISQADVISLLSFFILSCILSYFNYGFMSLVLSFVISQAIRACTLKFFDKNSYSIDLRLRDLKSTLHKSKYFMLSTLIATIRARSDVIILGLTTNLSALGIYTLAFAITDSLQSQLSSIINKTLFPVYSKLSKEKEQRKRYYLNSAKYISLIMFSVYILIYYLSEPLIVNLLGEDWEDAIPIIKVLCIAAIVYAFGGYPSEIINASGRPDITFRISLINYLLVSLPSLIIFSYLWGAIGAAYSVVLHYSTLRVSHVVALKQLSIVGVRELLKTALPGSIVLITLTIIGNIWKIYT